MAAMVVRPLAVALFDAVEFVEKVDAVLPFVAAAAAAAVVGAARGAILTRFCSSMHPISLEMA